MKIILKRRERIGRAVPRRCPVRMPMASVTLLFFSGL
jgi:hypothetical protein